MSCLLSSVRGPVIMIRRGAMKSACRCVCVCVCVDMHACATPLTHIHCLCACLAPYSGVDNEHVRCAEHICPRHHVLSSCLLKSPTRSLSLIFAFFPPPSLSRPMILPHAPATACARPLSSQLVCVCVLHCCTITDFVHLFSFMGRHILMKNTRCLAFFHAHI